MAVVDRRVELAAALTAPAEARRLVAAALGAWPPHRRALVQLLTSEVVTNAVLYGEGRIQIGVGLDADAVRVEVSDEGAGRPVPAPPDAWGEHGRGLLMVDAVSHEWGVDELDEGQGKVVWFVVTRRDDATP